MHAVFTVCKCFTLSYMHFKKDIRNATTNVCRRQRCALAVEIVEMVKVNPIIGKLTNLKLTSGTGTTKETFFSSFLKDLLFGLGKLAIGVL